MGLGVATDTTAEVEGTFRIEIDSWRSVWQIIVVWTAGRPLLLPVVVVVCCLVVGSDVRGVRVASAGRWGLQGQPGNQSFYLRQVSALKPACTVFPCDYTNFDVLHVKSGCLLNQVIKINPCFQFSLQPARQCHANVWPFYDLIWL